MWIYALEIENRMMMVMISCLSCFLPLNPAGVQAHQQQEYKTSQLDLLRPKGFN